MPLIEGTRIMAFVDLMNALIIASASSAGTKPRSTVRETPAAEVAAHPTHQGGKVVVKLLNLYDGNKGNESQRKRKAKGGESQGGM